MLVDSHAHLDAAQFQADLPQVIATARSAGVARIVSVGVDLETSQRAGDIADQFEMVMFAAGTHPSECAAFETEKGQLRSFIETAGPVAIGEIGLDYFRKPFDRDLQQRVFREQLAWAVELDLPVIVHDREAHDDIMGALEEFGPRGVLHCFSGSLEMALRAVALDLHVSFAGNVTYKSAIELQDVVRRIPGERLLVETDSPYLPPEGYRGKRNEPARIREVTEFIASLRGWSLDDAAHTTAENAGSLFGWP